MKKIIYTFLSEGYIFKANILYKEKIPKIIIQFIEGAIKNKSTIQKFIYKKIQKDSVYEKIILKVFKEYDSFLNKPYKGLTNILKNGFVERKTVMMGEVRSLNPILDKKSVTINNKEYSWRTTLELKKHIINSIQKDYENSFDIQVISIENQEDIESGTSIKLTAKDSSLFYKGDPINMQAINYDSMIEENKLVSVDNKLDDNTFQKIENFTEAHHFLDLENKYAHETSGNIFEIKDTSIEWIKINLWNNLLVFKKSIIREKEFSPGSEIYSHILDNFNRNKINLNDFIFTTFFREEDSFRKTIIKSEKFERYLSNKDILRAILLLDEDIKIEANININEVEKIISKASIKNIPTIINKLSDDLKNKITSLKLIKKIDDVDSNLLSEEQYRILKEERYRIKAIKEEYLKVIGEITSLGLREKIKSLNKKGLNAVGGKKTKKWLDKNIGHNKGDKIILEEQLEEAKKILNIFKKELKI